MYKTTRTKTDRKNFNNNKVQRTVQLLGRKGSTKQNEVNNLCSLED